MPKAQPKSGKKSAVDALKKSKAKANVISAADESADDGTGPLFFYGHKTPPHDFLSQHFLCEFTAPHPEEGKPDMTFKSTEQYMMFYKARLFEDYDMAEKIMKTGNPIQQKKYGRMVGFRSLVLSINHRSVYSGGVKRFMVLRPLIYVL
jgi:predicted NAD-dependent protein-ADP-ribosyltransferase YbiA (DUF1768 family)